ncbi:MAG TPA: YkgJ family cysteine cluster protein [Mycobacteriales bacterium]|nr:YkgJ family cysteine cluster protein [Mycobacteriales bacterium]
MPATPATCSACGDCCDPVWYPLGPADIRQSAATTGSADLVFAAAHWQPTGARTDDGLHAYRCDRFDAASRLCTAHDERPPICRGYPWYDDAPGTRLVLLPTRCSFRAVIGDTRPMPA